MKEALAEKLLARVLAVGPGGNVAGAAGSLEPGRL